MLDTVNVTVHPADGSPSVQYKVEHAQNVIVAFGRPDGRDRSWGLVDAPSSLLHTAFPHLAGLDPAVDVMHVDLPDSANANGRYATSACGLLLVPTPTGWVLMNPSGHQRAGQRIGGAVPTVRAWGYPPVNLAVAGGQFQLSEHQLAAVWMASNLGKMHRVDLQRDGSRTSSTYGASSDLTGRPDYRLSERNKRALVFFFEEYLRWGADPVFNPQPSGTARERIRRLEAAGQPVPVASWLRSLWAASNTDQGRGPTAPRATLDSEGRPIGPRADTSADRIWFLPENADKVAQLRSLEMALQWSMITKADVDRILAELDAAEPALDELVSDLTTRYEHHLRQQIPISKFAAAGTFADRERDRLIERIGALVSHALTHRSLNPTASPRDLPDLTGISVRELHQRLHHGGNSPIGYRDAYDRAERTLEEDELTIWGGILLGLPLNGA